MVSSKPDRFDIVDRNKSIDFMVNKVIKCRNCFLCCKNSSAFVLSYEVSSLRSLGVPLHQIDGVHFITPLRNGRCPNLSEENQCEIYDFRPISCRFFPFYILNRPDFKQKWVLFNFCPDKNRMLRQIDGRPNMAILRMIAFQLEKGLAPEEIDEILKSDAAIAKQDGLEVGGNHFIPIMSTQRNFCVFPGSAVKS